MGLNRVQPYAYACGVGFHHEQGPSWPGHFDLLVKFKSDNLNQNLCMGKIGFIISL
jgi:hypothetical protein